MPRKQPGGRRRPDFYETIFAAARDAVGEEPIAAGGVQDFANTGLNQTGLAVNETEILFTAARDAVGEEPIGMGGW